MTRGTYVALAVASGRAGELRRAFEAADLMRAAGFEPDDTTWRELLSSCARAGDADLAWRTYKQSRESGCPPNDVALNIIVGVTLLKIRELTDPENRANRRQQIDADAAALVDRLRATRLTERRLQVLMPVGTCAANDRLLTHGELCLPVSAAVPAVAMVLPILQHFPRLTHQRPQARRIRQRLRGRA